VFPKRLPVPSSMGSPQGVSEESSTFPCCLTCGTPSFGHEFVERVTLAEPPGKIPLSSRGAPQLVANLGKLSCGMGWDHMPPPDSPFTTRPSSRLRRHRLSEEEIEHVRRDRRVPRMIQWDYLHLAGLRKGLLASFRLVPSPPGPLLDLFCGTKPYLELIPWRPVWGLDMDFHFGRADVIGALPLPFRDNAFGVLLCSQALHLVDDPIGTVEEMARVLAPGGYVIVTIPHLFVGEGDFERHWSQADLGALFGDWRHVRIRGIGGPGAALAFALGRVTMRATRRWSRLTAISRPCIVLLNAVCVVLDWLSAPLHRRWPHSLLLVAERPGQPTTKTR
jgi:SAM-dependent methyltransferase